jgi:hypothetical protein
LIVVGADRLPDVVDEANCDHQRLDAQQCLDCSVVVSEL